LPAGSINPFSDIPTRETETVFRKPFTPEESKPLWTRAKTTKRPRPGEGVAKDATKATSWFRKAAKQGHRHAQYALGTAYDYGEGVEIDLAEAVKWYRKAAEQGHIDAQYRLGCTFDVGVEVSEKLQEAIKWYRKAAEQGHTQAKQNLGACESLEKTDDLSFWRLPRV
jgi:hypothetical protein